MAQLRKVAMAGLGVSLLIAVAGVFASGTLAARLFAAHGLFVTFAFLVPALEALNLHAMNVLVGRPVPADKQRAIGISLLAGSALLGLGAFLAPTHLFVARVALGLGSLACFAATGMLTGAVLKALPKRGTTVVDIARDPLTKGDDACLTQVKFSHFFLPVGALLFTVASPAWAWPAWTHGIWLAGAHILLLGYALVSTYALCHIWVPRLCGVPAIAAGAIKGELHSTLLGIVLMVAGFLLPSKGLLIAGGAFAFLGTFTFMGVLGANIMKNKSPTQRVTPQFAYIPWVFSGVFWVIAGVLLGIFLNAVPEIFAGKLVALKFAHVHSILLGGAAQLFMGILLRVGPRDAARDPAPFSRTKWGFYAWNVGFTILLVGELAGRNQATEAGAVLLTVGGAAWFLSLRATLAPRVSS